MSKDLIVLVADKNIEATIQGLLQRPQALGIRAIEFDIFLHPQKDPGCLNTSSQFLRTFINQYNFALVVFDCEGCGKNDPRSELEAYVENNLRQVGWADRSAAIILDPELEVWVWTKSSRVDEALGWGEQKIKLRSWLLEHHFLTSEQSKPKKPKEAMEAALRKVKKPRSSSIYLQLAKTVSLAGHQEPAFIKFQNQLQIWFSL